MIEFVNKITGGRMWVAEGRVDEYLQRGHKLAVFNDVETQIKPAEKPAKKPAKKSAKK